MEVLVTYDVMTDTPAGRRRLRRVAQACEGFGQRVQKSVFECSLSPADLERLKRKLLAIIEEKEDNLRFYRLQEPREKYLQAFGRAPSYDIHHPLVV